MFVLVSSRMKFPGLVFSRKPRCRAFSLGFHQTSCRIFGAGGVVYYCCSLRIVQDVQVRIVDEDRCLHVVALKPLSPVHHKHQEL